MISIAQRTVREINGLRPFQRETMDAIQSDAEIIVVEAPVGSGKSYIVQKAANYWNGPIVLTYPTKILMDTQRRTLKAEFPGSIIWPYESGIPRDNAPTIFYYSSDSLFTFLKRQNIDYCLDRSELMDKILHQHFFASKRNVLLTSPDVLHLLVNMKAYRGYKRLLSFFTGALVVFDEFHLYVGLKHFSNLIDNLLNRGIKKIVLLSATPVFSSELQTLFKRYRTCKVDFSSSIGEEGGKIFNYPLNLEFVNCRYTKRDELLKVLHRYIPKLPKPLAIIMDSIFRLRHIMPLLKSEFGSQFKFMEYSGFVKDSTTLDEKSILVGTSSIEVGINMVFKSLITEVSYWTSAIQRIGRVGRFCNGEVVVLTTKNMTPYIKSKTTMSRDELENNVLKSALKDIRMSHVCGEMFRGDSFPFLIYDIDSKSFLSYTESIFALYEPQKWVDDWQTLNINEKRQVLVRYGIPEEDASDILLRDKLFPFWGIIDGRLREKYERISIHHDGDELTVLCEESNRKFYFEGRV